MELDPCPMCGGEEWIELGLMGAFLALRCRACHAEILVDPEELSEEAV